MVPEKMHPFIDALNNTSLRYDRLPFFSAANEPLTVIDAVSKKQRDGQFFVSMRREVVQQIVGSTLTPDRFLKNLGVGDRPVLEANLLSESTGTLDNPVLRVMSEDKDFSLTVMHGSFNSRAMNLTRLATQNLNEEPVRAKYQSEVFELMKPILRKESTYDIRIAEDCIASGDVIAGVKTALAKIRPDIKQKSIRVDVAVATTQGILLLRKFAHDNNLNLEINAGYLAYGLSSGNKTDDPEAREHANYITYPQSVVDKASPAVKETLESLQQEDGNIYVVGDMGDAAKSIHIDSDGRYPWNKYRSDNHGTRNNEEPVEAAQDIDNAKPIDVFLKRGGFFIKSLVDYMAEATGQKKKQSTMFFGNRVWATAPHGYGVLINGLPLNDAYTV